MSLLSKKTDTDSIKHEERLVRVKIRDTFFFRPPSPPLPPHYVINPSLVMGKI